MFDAVSSHVAQYDDVYVELVSLGIFFKRKRARSSAARRTNSPTDTLASCAARRTSQSSSPGKRTENTDDFFGRGSWLCSSTWAFVGSDTVVRL